MNRRTFIKCAASVVGFLCFGKIPAVAAEKEKPRPPGTVCPACGSSDWDLENGTLMCNNCGCEWEIRVVGYTDYYNPLKSMPPRIEIRILTNRDKDIKECLKKK